MLTVCRVSAASSQSFLPPPSGAILSLQASMSSRHLQPPLLGRPSVQKTVKPVPKIWPPCNWPGMSATAKSTTISMLPSLVLPLLARVLANSPIFRPVHRLTAKGTQNKWYVLCPSFLPADDSSPYRRLSQQRLRRRTIPEEDHVREQCSHNS